MQMQQFYAYGANTNSDAHIRNVVQPDGPRVNAAGPFATFGRAWGTQQSPAEPHLQEGLVSKPAEPESPFKSTPRPFVATPAPPESQVQPETQAHPENSTLPTIQAPTTITNRNSQTGSKWYCGPCKEPFNNGKIYGQHMNKVHSEKAFFCDWCGLTFVRPDYRKPHLSVCKIYRELVAKGIVDSSLNPTKHLPSRSPEAPGKPSAKRSRPPSASPGRRVNIRDLGRNPRKSPMPEDGELPSPTPAQVHHRPTSRPPEQPRLPNPRFSSPRPDQEGSDMTLLDSMHVLIERIKAGKQREAKMAEEIMALKQEKSELLRRLMRFENAEGVRRSGSRC